MLVQQNLAEVKRLVSDDSTTPNLAPVLQKLDPLERACAKYFSDGAGSSLPQLNLMVYYKLALLSDSESR